MFFFVCIFIVAMGDLHVFFFTLTSKEGRGSNHGFGETPEVVQPAQRAKPSVTPSDVESLMADNRCGPSKSEVSR